MSKASQDILHAILRSLKERSVTIFLGIFLFCTGFVFSIERKEHPAPLKISVVIPCHPNHFKLLEPLLCLYREQTSLPDEIVVSLSEAHLVSKDIFQELKDKHWPFEVLFLATIDKQLPGKNRNRACIAATGDVIVCQDADDLPHPQRIEAIRYLFENFQIEHLLHQWIPSDSVFKSFDVQGLEQQCIKHRMYEQIKTLQIHNGSVSFLRTVFEKIHWPPHLTINEDATFNRHAYVFFPDHYVLQQPLIRYRGELSTFDLNGDRVQTKELEGSDQAVQSSNR